MPIVHDPQLAGLEERPAGEAPLVVRDLTADPTPSSDSLEVAKAAVLKAREMAVLVDILAARPGGVFLGEISGFEPPVGAGRGGMRVGDRITFRAEHVFSYDV